MACADKVDKTWERVAAGAKLTMSVTGNKDRFTAAASYFDADGSEEFWRAADLIVGPKESRAFGSPGKTHLLIARVIIDETAPPDLKVEVKSTIAGETHCTTVTAKGTTRMVHTIRMKEAI